jgi:ubiquinone/menaquinone biosynthesis C-methylase UbiE
MPEKILWPFSRLYDRYPNRIFTKWFRLIAKNIKDGQISGTVLDIGTGPGRLPIEIVKQVVNAQVVGIDLSEDMVKIAKGHAEKAGLADRVKFKVASAYNTGSEDNSVNLVVSTGMFHHLKEPVRAFNEIYRILKPGGEAWIFDGRKDVTRAEFEETVRTLGIESDLPLPLWFIERAWPHWHVGCKTWVYISGKIGIALKGSLFKDYSVNSEGAYVRIVAKK